MFRRYTMKSIGVIMKRIGLFPIMTVFLMIHVTVLIAQLRVTSNNSLLEYYDVGAIGLSAVYGMIYMIIKERFANLYPEFRMYPIPGAKLIRLLLSIIDMITCILILVTGIITAFFGQMNSFMITVCFGILIQLFLYYLISKGAYNNFKTDNNYVGVSLIIGIIVLKSI